MIDSALQFKGGDEQTLFQFTFAWSPGEFLHSPQANQVVWKPTSDPMQNSVGGGSQVFVHSLLRKKSDFSSQAVKCHLSPCWGDPPPPSCKQTLPLTFRLERGTCQADISAIDSVCSLLKGQSWGGGKWQEERPGRKGGGCFSKALFFLVERGMYLFVSVRDAVKQKHPSPPFPPSLPSSPFMQNYTRRAPAEGRC